ncbi:MAG: DUF6690 family protein [Thermoguttaceae bacterium]
MGIKKSILYAGGLALATGIPFTMYSAPDMAKSVQRAWVHATTASTPAKTSTNVVTEPAPAGAARPIAAAATNPNSLAAMPMPRLDEVLRFDATVEWVMQRWPRVSTGLPYLQLQGYRVPLVTGTSLDDLAGSLTYYFNAHQQVQRITLRGTTGDPRSMVGLLADRYRFTRRLTNDPSIVLYETVNTSNQLAGSLKIRSAKVVKSDQPYSRFEFDLVIDRTE